MSNLVTMGSEFYWVLSIIWLEVSAVHLSYCIQLHLQVLSRSGHIWRRWFTSPENVACSQWPLVTSRFHPTATPLPTCPWRCDFQCYAVPPGKGINLGIFHFNSLEREVVFLTILHVFFLFKKWPRDKKKKIITKKKNETELTTLGGIKHFWLSKLCCVSILFLCCAVQTFLLFPPFLDHPDKPENSSISEIIHIYVQVELAC